MFLRVSFLVLFLFSLQAHAQLAGLGSDTVMALFKQSKGLADLVKSSADNLTPELRRQIESSLSIVRDSLAGEKLNQKKLVQHLEKISKDDPAIASLLAKKSDQFTLDDLVELSNRLNQAAGGFGFSRQIENFIVCSHCLPSELSDIGLGTIVTKVTEADVRIARKIPSRLSSYARSIRKLSESIGANAIQVENVPDTEKRILYLALSKIQNPSNEGERLLSEVIKNFYRGGDFMDAGLYKVITSDMPETSRKKLAKLLSDSFDKNDNFIERKTKLLSFFENKAKGNNELEEALKRLKDKCGFF